MGRAGKSRGQASNPSPLNLPQDPGPGPHSECVTRLQVPPAQPPCVSRSWWPCQNWGQVSSGSLGAYGDPYLQGRLWAGALGRQHSPSHHPTSSAHTSNPAWAAQLQVGSSPVCCICSGCLGDEFPGYRPRLGTGWSKVEQMSSWTTLLLFT